MDEISSMKKFELIRISGWIASGNSEQMFQKCSFLSIGSFSDNFSHLPCGHMPPATSVVGQDMRPVFRPLKNCISRIRVTFLLVIAV